MFPLLSVCYRTYIYLRFDEAYDAKSPLIIYYLKYRTLGEGVAFYATKRIQMHHQ